MEETGKPKRAYHSQRREEQAQETRRRILAAALKLFSRHGYSGATIEAIAQEAGVSPLTVFSAFGNKRTILARLLDLSVGGDEQPIPLLQRPEQQMVLQEPDPEQQIRQFAAGISNILERVSPVFEIMRMAAKTEPEIAGMVNQMLERRMRNLGVFVQSLSAHARLRMEEAQATETVWSIAGPDLYRLLTVDRGWTKEQFVQWLGDTLVRLLLEQVMSG